MPDFYGILGVPRDASAEDVKRAYRRLARESHPDANPDDPHAEERFKQISEAYQVLSDPDARGRYDAFGTADPRAGAGAGGFGDLGDIMEAFFGGGPFGRARTRQRTAAVAGQDVGASVTLTFDEAVFGAKRPVDFTALGRCERCNGEGCEPGTFRSRCQRCGGQGEIRATRQTILGTVVTSRPCPACGGAGEAPAVPCVDCRGAGRTARRFSHTIEVPPGVQDGMTLRLRGNGEQGARGGPDGDLFVSIAVEPHEVFERDGDDLACAMRVPVTQAILGAEMPVQTLDGIETIRIAPGTQHGTVVRIKGKGAPRLDRGGRGDLRVYLAVEVPQKLTPEERALIEQLAELRGETISPDERGIFQRLRDTLRGQ